MRALSLLALSVGLAALACSDNGSAPPPGDRECYVGDNLDTSLEAPVLVGEVGYDWDSTARRGVIQVFWEDRASGELCYVVIQLDGAAGQTVTRPPVRLPAGATRFESPYDDRTTSLLYAWHIYAASATGRSPVLEAYYVQSLP